MTIKRLHLATGIVVIATIFSCANRNLNSEKRKKEKDLSHLFEMMTGEFSSEEQAKEDSLFYNINLVMFPIWENDETAKWLYVEQAVTKYINKPYRQRVYKLSIKDNNVIESRVFELNNPSKYIHAWNNSAIFNEINPDSLILRQGCAVFLKRIENCYSGSTNNKDCKSSLRGAAYATSKVSICEDEIVSWDQGWNLKDQQVWGAETKGYIFKRKKSFN